MKHITVTPADDDEIVVAGDVGSSPGSAARATGGQGESGAPVEAPDRGAEPSSAAAGTGAAGPAARTGRQRVAKPKAPAQPKDGGYHETTLEDLESSRMPTAQKIVIIAAVVCIIGALVYYFALMR